MKLNDQYRKNRPFLNSILTGFLYFLFCWSIDFGDATKSLFYILMMFLPGLTFPLTTCYYKTVGIHPSRIKIGIHLALSIAIYHVGIWLHSDEVHVKFISILAGLLGSLLFQLITKYLLNKAISLKQIIITSILSGIAFLPFVVIEQNGFFEGLAVFFWTLINGKLINDKYKKVTYH